MDRRELTRPEIEIVKLVAIGLTNVEIAEDLEVSMATVKRHGANVMLKWNVQESDESRGRSHSAGDGDPRRTLS